jgi:hypothetical protein
MIDIIGGKCDGQKSPVKLVTFTEGDETYMLMSYKEAETKYFFYVLTGPNGVAPSDALKTHRDRRAKEMGFKKL